MHFAYIFIGATLGLFLLDPENGILTVAAPLRGKGRGEPYELKVRAVDQGTPQQFSEAIIKLYIGDVSANDGVPVFVRPKPNEVANILEVRYIGLYSHQFLEYK